MSINETFNLRSGGEHEAEIKKMINDLSQSQVTAENYSKYADMVKNHNTIINAQIENEYQQYVDILATYKELKDQDRIQTALNDGFAPKEFYEAIAKLHYLSRQIVSWKFLQSKMNEILAYKVTQALSESRAFDIKRDSLREMKEHDERRNKLFLDIMVNRFNIMDEKFITSLKNINEYNLLDKKEIINVLATALSEANKSNIEVLRTFSDIIGSLSLPEEQKKLIQEKVDEKEKELNENMSETKLEMKKNVSGSSLDRKKKYDKSLDDLSKDFFEQVENFDKKEEEKPAPVVEEKVDDDFLKDFDVED